MDSTLAARRLLTRVYIRAMRRLLPALALLLVLAPAASGHNGRTTVDQTITGGDPAEAFQFLKIGPGEPYAVRGDILAPRAGRERGRVSLAYFGQITDFQLADEESPARVEFLDPDPSGTAGSAWRPQEAFVVHAVDQSIRAMNRFLSSPVPQGDGSRAQLVNAVMTGDLADNMQRNETEWVVRLLEGGTLDPNSGTADLAGTSCPPGTPLDDPEKYTGVQDYDDYFESPAFYDPDRPIGQYANWPAYPGLMDRAQVPFEAEGLKVPSYSLFGNHDGLVQGNEDAVRSFEDLATGCVKPYSPATTELSSGLDPGFLAALAGTSFNVPPDPNRQFVDKAQFMALHNTGRQADAHGFAYVPPAEREASAGAAAYYAWTPVPGVRFVAIDTLSEGGMTPTSSDGNIDDPQWKWLEKELDAATARNELIVVFGHHGTSSLTADVADEEASDCAENDEHGHDTNPGCDRDPRSSQPLHLAEEVAALLLAHPHVVAFVAGHSHNNRVQPFKSDRGSGFWEIKSPAISDWPPQQRLIELMENCDGTLSIFGTMLDHEGPVDAPKAGPAGGFSPAELASIGRVITYNDPQGDNADSAGLATDRNVELLLDDPRSIRPADPKLRLRVRPRRVRPSRRTRLTFRLTTRSGEPVKGAVVRFKHRRARTNATGVARMRIVLRARSKRRGRVTQTMGCTERKASSAQVMAPARRRR
jgi:metallophosphoesterase (TIGR03767 family)